MIRSIQRRYFEVWGDEEAQNVFLKGLLSVLTGLFVIQSIVLTVLACRKPVLVAVGAGETRVFNVVPPGEELLISELKRLVRQYVETHYNWDFATIERAHAEAARFVSEKFVKAFMAANVAQVKQAKEKKISERVYPSAEVQVDSKALTARVALDRIFSVDGIRATSPLVLDITFEYGPRTQGNPEGIYITGEKVVTPDAGG
jgi:uncharacterized protein (UPF0305 family)